MRTWTAALLLSGLFVAGCATNNSNPNAGGQAGQAGEGGTGGSVAASSSSTGGQGATGGMGGTAGVGGMGGEQGGQGGGVNLCGNGVVDPGESCDGTDFGGKTCQSLGLGSGTLICNQYCGIVATSCVPLENCLDGMDNDLDGKIDCLDSDCAMAPPCLDSCTPPQTAAVPDYKYSDTTGRPSIHASSCATTSGPEVIYQVVAPTTGTLALSLYGGTAFTLSVRTSCGDDASEIACTNQSDGFGDYALGVPVTQGQTVFVMIDGNGATSMGYYDLQLDMPLPESGSQCKDFTDNDADGYLDCDDASACQGSAQCQPGAQATGTACTQNTQCAATGGDPICLPNFSGWPGGYCSEFCDVAAPDCSGDAVCADLGLSVHGVCLDGCVVNSDCRLGYACIDKGLSSKVCVIGPEAQCSDWSDNDSDNLTDCEDPDLCQTLPDCTPGPGAVGTACTQNNQCQATGNDPLCISEAQAFGFTGGYCSEFCNLGLNDCPTGSVCLDYLFWPSNSGNCFDLCTSQADCRTDYQCDTSFGPHVCLPSFVPFP